MCGKKWKKSTRGWGIEVKHITLLKNKSKGIFLSSFKEQTKSFFPEISSLIPSIQLHKLIKLLRYERLFQWREAGMVGENWKGNSKSQRLTAVACSIQQAAFFIHVYFHFSGLTEVSDWLTYYLSDTQPFVLYKALSHLIAFLGATQHHLMGIFFNSIFIDEKMEIQNSMQFSRLPS